MASGLRFALHDARSASFLGMARATDGLLTQDSLVLRGRRFGGLDVVLRLSAIRKLTQRVIPHLTLVVHTHRGTIDVPAGAHDLGEIQELCHTIEDAVRKHRARHADVGEGSDDRAALDALLAGAGGEDEPG